MKHIRVTAPAIEFAIFLVAIWTSLWYIAALAISGLGLSIAIVLCVPARRTRRSRRRAASRRRERMKANGGSHTAQEWRELCERWKWRCAACGRQEPLTKDHIVAVAQGGSDDIRNIQPLCRSCNSSKNNATFDYRKAWR